MKRVTVLQAESYDPDRLLNTLIERFNFKNDAGLARALEIAPPMISKLRHRRLPVGPAILIRMHEVTEMSIRELRELMGDATLRPARPGKQAA